MLTINWKQNKNMYDHWINFVVVVRIYFWNLANATVCVGG